MKVDRVVTGYLKENCYILTIGEECIVIDPGDDDSLIKERIGHHKVLAILLTHHHFDHVASLDTMVKQYHAVVYSFDNLKEEEKAVNHFKFTVIYTPGHTSDSITFYFPAEKMMFTGDFLFDGSIGRCDLPTGNILEMKESIEKIKKYPNDIVLYPGHGNSTTLEIQKNNNQYLFTN